MMTFSNRVIRRGRRCHFSGFGRVRRSMASRLSRWPLVPPPAAHRPHPDGTRARCDRRCDRDFVRPVRARGLQVDHQWCHVGRVTGPWRFPDTKTAKALRIDNSDIGFLDSHRKSRVADYRSALRWMTRRHWWA